MTRGDVTGWLAGIALAPLTGFTSAVRRSRMFHPSGVLCAAEALTVARMPSERDVAARLAGPVLLRWSSAWWKTGEWKDVLGCALRFTRAPLGVDPQPDDQDLLLATIQRPWTMALAPLTTRRHDFLANAYFGVSPFDVPPLGRVEWRLRALAGGAPGADRRARLLRAIETGRARLVLEWAPYAGPWARPRSGAFRPLVDIAIHELLDLDQQHLRFDPFRAGRGVQPVGFVHAMRRATYGTSQALRPG